MATTLDGVMRGAAGGSREISTPADQRWFAALRRQPDALLVGAQTIRAEDYRPSRKVMAIVSGSLDLPPDLRMFAERSPEHPRPIVFTTARAARTPPDHLSRLADVVPCGEDTVDLGVARRELVDRGLTRIQCEGGPSLLSTLMAMGLLDELLLSLTPYLIGGGPSEHLLNLDLDSPARMTLVDMQEDEGTVFMRLRAA
jgi:riboflavin biosynthesis pyrimidine reductase